MNAAFCAPAAAAGEARATFIAAHQSAAVCRTAPTQDVGRQLTIDDAVAAGERGASLSLDAATRRDPEFKIKAERAIVSHLAAAPHRQAAGEDLVDIARAHGAVPPDDRAFGGIFQSLMRRGVIRCLRSDLPRKRGHGTSGGKLWGLVA